MQQRCCAQPSDMLHIITQPGAAGGCPCVRHSPWSVVASPRQGKPPPTRQAEVNRWPVRRAIAASQSYTKARPKSSYHYLLQARSSTSVTSQKCRDPGSNRGPSDLQSDALPAELSRLMCNKKSCCLNVLPLGFTPWPSRRDCGTCSAVACACG